MANSDNLPKAYIKHELPGRVRLKIPEKRGDSRYFDQIADAFVDCSGIRQLQLNAASASLLVLHETQMPFATVAKFAAEQDLFIISEERPEEIVNPLADMTIAALSSAGLNRVDTSLAHFSRGKLDIRSSLFLGLLGLAIHQAAKGNIMAPAASLFWYALEMLQRQNESMFSATKDKSQENRD